jgi:hypothetical protein
VVVGTFRDLFVAVAGSAATLTGLLFVALSVTPRRGAALGPAVILQVRTAAALLSFTNALAVWLVTSLLVGVSRAWELVGDRDTGLSASVAVLLGRRPPGEAGVRGAGGTAGRAGDDQPPGPGGSG